MRVRPYPLDGVTIMPWTPWGEVVGHGCDACGGPATHIYRDVFLCCGCHGGGYISQAYAQFIHDEDTREIGAMAKQWRAERDANATSAHARPWALSHFDRPSGIHDIPVGLATVAPADPSTARYRRMGHGVEKVSRDGDGAECGTELGASMIPQRFRRFDLLPARKENGQWICRGCQQPITAKRRTSWCTDQCRINTMVQFGPGYVRTAVWKRDKGRCAKCGRRWTTFKSAWEADHIIAVVDGGGCCSIDNFRTLCAEPCHREETAKLRLRLAQARRAQLRLPLVD